MQHGGLQDAPERERLIRLALAPARVLLDVLLQVMIEIRAQLRQIGAARGEDPLAFGVVGEHVQQVLDGEVRVAPRHGLPIRHAQQQFD